MEEPGTRRGHVTAEILWRGGLVVWSWQEEEFYLLNINYLVVPGISGGTIAATVAAQRMRELLSDDYFQRDGRISKSGSFPGRRARMLPR